MSASRNETTAPVQAANKETAVRFIHGFNHNDWDAVRDVVTPGFVFIILLVGRLRPDRKGWSPSGPDSRSCHPTRGIRSP